MRSSQLRLAFILIAMQQAASVAKILPCPETCWERNATAQVDGDRFCYHQVIDKLGLFCKDFEGEGLLMPLLKDDTSRKFYMQYVKESGLDFTYVGIRKVLEDNRWYWIDGEEESAEQVAKWVNGSEKLGATWVYISRDEQYNYAYSAIPFKDRCNFVDVNCTTITLVCQKDCSEKDPRVGMPSEDTETVDMASTTAIVVGSSAGMLLVLSLIATIVVRKKRQENKLQEMGENHPVKDTATQDFLRSDGLSGTATGALVTSPDSSTKQTAQSVSPMSSMKKTAKSASPKSSTKKPAKSTSPKSSTMKTEKGASLKSKKRGKSISAKSSTARPTKSTRASILTRASMLIWPSAATQASAAPTAQSPGSPKTTTKHAPKTQKTAVKSSKQRPKKSPNAKSMTACPETVSEDFRTFQTYQGTCDNVSATYV